MNRVCHAPLREGWAQLFSGFVLVYGPVTGFLLPPPPPSGPRQWPGVPWWHVTCPSPHHPLICMSAGSWLPLFSWPHIPHCWRVADGSQCSLDWSAERGQRGGCLNTESRLRPHGLPPLITQLNSIPWAFRSGGMSCKMWTMWRKLLSRINSFCSVIPWSELQHMTRHNPHVELLQS